MKTTIPRGRKAFDITHGKVSASGWQFALNEARMALSGVVANRVADVTAKEELESSITSLVLTRFEAKNLARLMQSQIVPTWRIGEAVAECYLEEHHECIFPWHSGRDLRNPNASQAGADIVGLRNKGTTVAFAFGEVKTSEDSTQPPGVLYGRSGMIAQIETLARNTDVTDTLVRYLGFRHKGQAWESDYRTACKAYLGDRKTIWLTGILVRTTAPHEDDLRARAKTLSECDTPDILLLALYVSIPIKEWQDNVSSGQKVKL
ncbi:MAG: hypothetical protein PHW60_03480 [Kiritimatiellae bacterium]|nr:hypothetical protein [Kiritimatiellia bacterium]